ncbi:MAG: tetratricopeptide repeat protein [Acidobacteriaceae bacterium]|jgi:CHAT domain-containing protein/Tfp pilus assembly protein PilF
MRARSIGVFASVPSALLLFVTIAIAASVNPPLNAQQPGITAGTGPAPALPAEAQEKLDKLQSDFKAAQTAGDAKAEARTQNAIGDLYFGVSAFPQAQDAYSQALALSRTAKDAELEAAALNGIGSCYRNVSQNDKAQEAYQQALDVATTANDLRGQAAALNGIGWVSENLGEAQKALDYQNKALPLAQKANDEGLEAAILRRIGYAEGLLGEPQKALDSYNKALAINRRLGDLDGEARVLLNIGSLYHGQSEEQKALDYYGQALSAFRQVGDRAMEAMALSNLGVVYTSTGQSQKAIESFGAALPIRHQIGDRQGEAVALLNLGDLYQGTGEPHKAIDQFNQALLLFRQIGNRQGEALVIKDTGVAYYRLSETKEALESFNQALSIFRELGDLADEGKVLNNMGVIYRETGEPRNALDYDTQALVIFRQLGNHHDEAAALSNNGIAYWNLGELQKALDSFNQSLAIRRQISDPDGEAIALDAIGVVYWQLGEPNKTLDYDNQALPLYRQVGDQDGEAKLLANVGLAHFSLGQYQDALDSFNQQLAICRKIGNRDVEAKALENIGMVYEKMKEPQKALDVSHQAVLIYREVSDRSGESATLNNEGNYFDDLGEIDKSLDSYMQALPIAAAVGDPLAESDIFHSLMLNRKGQPALAVFYGKQAVNLLQQVRGNIQDLDKELQKSFVSSVGDCYHDLANLLIAQGRLPEAQQVLDLLKQQEYSDYVRGESVDPVSPLSLTPAERQAEQDYQTSTAQLVSLGEQWSQLKNIGTRTPDQEKEYQQISDQLTKASQGLNAYYTRLYTLFGASSDANKQVADVKGDVSLLKQTIAKMPNTVALYTLVGKDHYSVIVVTGSTTVAREYAIPESDLNKKVADFQQALRNPSRDVKPLAQDLYKILIGPVKADLDQAKAQTLVWSLDGVLRYIPMAALYDGKQYMVENYNTVTITPVSIPHLAEKPDVSDLSAVAMGISRKYEDSLPALPSVAGELGEVVKDAQTKDPRGVLLGTILLNDNFTEAAMETQLSGQHTVVHIASHFVFKPGDDSQSYLLLAGKDKDALGYHLTVADFRDNQKLSLEDADLLTLSACETGMSGNAGDGREVDGLGTTAQLKGAKAVISSLWEVNDASTGELMADFYKRWVDGGGKVAKVEALREAQLDLLRSKVTPQPSASGRGINVVGREPNVQASYAHPYYWAAFVLMGNWK